MRQIATLADETAARKFADYLLTLKIDSRVTTDTAGIALWVCDEDQVERARQELAEFTRDPNDARYGQASGVARELRQQEAREEKEYARRQHDLAEEMAKAGTRRMPMTIALLLVSVAATLTTNFGKSETSPVLQELSIASYTVEGRSVYWPHLEDVRSGQVWRLVTPIFLHFDLLHLVFNMMMLYSLGGAVETARGSGRFLLLVLLVAVTSNVSEYYLQMSFVGLGPPWVEVRPSPLFGGMSGVIYGLFGYVWMKSRFAPELGLHMSRENAIVMLVWLVVCMFGLVGSIANVAHLVGLIVGVAVGFAPRLWRRTG